MVAKSGFLLIEVMISLLTTFLLIFILTHYITEIKNIQHEALLRIELLTCARNCVEKMIATNEEYKKDAMDNNAFIVTLKQNRLDTDNKSELQDYMRTIEISKNGNKSRRSTTLPLYLPQVNALS